MLAKNIRKAFVNSTFILIKLSIFCQCHFAFAENDEFDEDQFYDDFRLIDSFDESQALSYYSDFEKVLIIGFQLSCKTITSEIQNLLFDFIKLENEKKVKVFFIDPDLKDDRLRVRKFMASRNITIPVLMDKTQMISFEYNIKKSGDFILINSKNLKPYFAGSIFSKSCTKALKGQLSRSNKIKEGLCKSSYLESALNLFKTGPSTLKTCNFNIQLTPNINYIDHVAPVIKKHCYHCHYDDTFGSFRGYDQLVGWAKMIRQVVRLQRMPIDGRDYYYGRFMGDINPAKLKPLIEWVNAGAKRGIGVDILKKLPSSLEPYLKQLGFYDTKGSTINASYLPPMSKNFLNNFTFFKKKAPDIVIKQKKSHVLPATGIVEYQYEQLAGPLSKELWVRAVDVKLNKRVVHHANIFYTDLPLNDHIKMLRKRNLLYSKDNMMRAIHNKKSLGTYKDEHGIVKVLEEQNLVTTKKFVDLPTLFPKGTAVKVPKGKYLVIEYHYETSGRVENNQTIVNLYLANSKEKLKEKRRLLFFRGDFVIPPNAKNYRVISQVKVDRDISLLSFKPHFHYRGKSIKYIANYADGRSEILLSVPFFKFKWQAVHTLREPKWIPKGTEIVTEVVYDNSKEFFQNPDSSEPVQMGGQTFTDEMHLPRITFVDGHL